MYSGTYSSCGVFISGGGTDLVRLALVDVMTK